ncbi:MAG: hypothetical protein NTW87_18410 [Planctomycetota bacterium]|nr:hypothetical protein [Planctomycetota bacterium]
MTRNFLGLGLSLACVIPHLGYAADAAGGAANTPLRAVPANGQIVLRDYGARDWGPELVHFLVDTARFVPGKLVLTDARAKAVPFQIEGGTLAFVASVGKGQTVTYTLAASDKDRSGENSTLKSSVQGDWFEMGNEHIALRMPKPGLKTCDPPIEAAAAPAPIAQWRPAGLEQWLGGARFATARKVKSHAFAILRQGPAAVEYEARYTFEPPGQYVWRVRVVPGAPVAVVTEEFDFGAVTNGEDLLLLELNKGWQPAQISISAATGEGSAPGDAQRQPFPKYLDDKKKTGAKSTANVAGFGVPPDPLQPEPGLVLLEKIVPGGKWGGLTGGVQLFADAPAGPRLGIATLHLGSWRRAMALNVWHKEGTGIVVGLPLSVRLSRWYLDIADDQSPFSTHEHDEGLSPTYGRREWCFYLGENINTAQPQFGLIGLDRYKDWVVDVPESDEARKSYPRAFFTRQLGERLKRTLDQHPLKAEVGSYYIVSGKTDDAVKHAQQVIQGLKADPTGNWRAQGLTHYRQSQFLAFVNKADDALACPDLPADLRAELRQWLALWAHLLSEPDIVPRGSGVHHGNNNMTFNRTLALPYFAGLLPDHPLYGYWMQQMKQWTMWKLASQTAYDGPFIEAPSYAVYGPMRYLLSTTMILRTTGTTDLAQWPHIPRFLEYFAHLSTSDTRFGGKRIIPGMGNSCNLSERLWGISLAVLEPSQKDEVGFFKFIQRLAQGNELGKRWEESETGYPLWYLPDIPEQPRDLKTTFLPTFGVIFRAHFNQPAETAMLFRAGFNWSHWDTDALNTILYSKGAPLSPGTGYQYYSGPATENNAVYHNQVKLDRPDLPELFGRVDTGVLDHGFTDAADYALGDRYYPAGLFADGKATVWRRHIVFVKSKQPDGPNYFVMRDTFPGGEHRKKWWNWMNLGKADMVEIKGQDLELKTPYGASTRVWFSRPHEIKPRLTFEAGRHDGLPGPEIKTIVEAAAKGGEDFFYVVYPHKDGEALPRFERLGDACLKVATSESTDYVFANDEPVKFEQDGVVLEGKAGVVRVHPKELAASLLAGSGRIGYKGAIFAGHGPFQRTVALADMQAGSTPVTDTYEKKWQAVDIGGGVTIAGEGPFDAKLDGQAIRVTTKGRARIMRVTRPKWILRPQLWVDGAEFMACWTDYPGSNWGRLEGTELIAMPVPEGQHELLLKNMVFPPVWKRPFTPAIESALVK